MQPQGALDTGSGDAWTPWTVCYRMHQLGACLRLCTAIYCHIHTHLAIITEKASCTVQSVNSLHSSPWSSGLSVPGKGCTPACPWWCCVSSVRSGASRPRTSSAEPPAAPVERPRPDPVARNRCGLSRHCTISCVRDPSHRSSHRYHQAWCSPVQTARSFLQAL